MGALGGEQLAAHALGDEEAHRVGLADRGRRAVGAADRVLGGHDRRRKGSRSSGFGSATIWYSIPQGWRKNSRSVPNRSPGSCGIEYSRQAIGPEADRADRHRQVQRLGLVGAALAHPAGLAVRERRQQRARVAEAVAVVQVVDRDLAVEQHGLLDALESEHAHVEVVVLLGAADAERQVVGTADEARMIAICPRVLFLGSQRADSNLSHASAPRTRARRSRT